MGLSKADKVELAATILEMLVANESDDAIMSTLGLDADTFYEAKRFLLESKAGEYRSKSREHVFVEYMIEQKANVRMVDNLLTKLDGGPGGKMHYNAFVGAIRLRADLTDRVLERGFDLGMFRKTTQSSGGSPELAAGVKGVAGMTDADLRREISEMTSGTAEMMARFGDEDMSSVETGPLHRGPGLIDALVEDDEALLAVEPEPEPEAPPPAKPTKPPVVVRKKAVVAPKAPVKR